LARSLRKEFLNAPNAITLVRIAMIPVFLYFTYVESRVNSFIAGMVYAVTGTTDFLDGWIARKKGLVTLIGKFLDPLADKLIVMAALVMLVHLGRVAAWVVIVVMAREFMVNGLRTIAMGEGIVIAAGQEGKQKTAFQVAAITFLIIHYTYPIDALLFSFDPDAEPVPGGGRVHPAAHRAAHRGADRRRGVQPSHIRFRHPLHRRHRLRAAGALPPGDGALGQPGPLRRPAVLQR
jgi:CDP-diacylglycerol--glycerol-3-phosphate 3-phosphatidyltransferase